jgi:hypothetical protein
MKGEEMRGIRPISGEPILDDDDTDALIYKCRCRCVCDNETLRNQPLCSWCFLQDHEGSGLIGPPKPSRLSEQRVYVFDDGTTELR